jgi:hypothetical protein
MEDNNKMDLKIGYGLDSTGSGYGPMAVSYEHCNEPSGSIKSRGFLYRLSDCQLLKRTLLCDALML